MRNLFRIIALCTFSFVCLSFSFEDNAKIYGYWWSPEKDAKIKIFKATDGKVYGKFTWFKEPNDADGTPKTDSKNPVVSKRTTPLLDMIFLRSFDYVGDNKWENGTIYDPQSGKTYNCILTLENDKTLNIRGYVGFSMLGRTAVFTKVE